MTHICSVTTPLWHIFAPRLHTDTYLLSNDSTRHFRNLGPSYTDTFSFESATIFLWFHLLFTRKRWKRTFEYAIQSGSIWNATKWKRNNLKTYPCNRGLKLRSQVYTVVPLSNRRDFCDFRREHTCVRFCSNGYAVVSALNFPMCSPRTINPIHTGGVLSTSSLVNGSELRNGTSHYLETWWLFPITY